MPPRKKSAKKGSTEPKASVGRPRKNLGTRVSDLPLVSIVKPTTRRINVDSLAMNRARMAYKRDYGKVLDERTARALIDAMSTTKRGPIGNAVVGTFKGQDVKFDLPGGMTATESSGFVDYYKQAKKALDKNPKQKVKVKFKDDGSYTFTTPGIPATTSSKLDSSSVPKQSAKSAATQSQMFVALEEIQAKIAALTQGIESGSFDEGAAELARRKIEELKGKVVTIKTAIEDAPVPKNSPLDTAATLKLERMRQLERAQNMNLDSAEREFAKAQVKSLDRRIKSNERATAVTIPASEEDITAAVLGPAEPEVQEVPLKKRNVKPTRTISREEAEAGPSSSQAGPSRPSAPAPAAAVEALAEALSDPQVAAVVEQARENAPVSTKPAKDPLANMRRVAEAARRMTARDAEIAKQKAGQARLKEERAKDEALPEDQPRRTVEQDFSEREAIGQSSRESGAKFIQMAQDARDNAAQIAATRKERRAKQNKDAQAAVDREEAATRVAATIAAPTPFVALQRKQRAKTASNATEKARIREIERLKQEAIDQEAEVRQEMMDQAVQEQLQADEAAGVDSFVGPAIRDAAADAADGDRTSAASKIQRMIRARRGREADRLSEYKRLDAERALRINEAQKEIAAEDAATKIQRMIRARREREAERLSEYQRLVAERDLSARKESAASTIQAAMRSALARGELKSRADRAYRPAEGPVYDEEAANDRDAALRIQSLFRGKRTRKELAEAAKSAALEGITQTLSRGNDEAAKQAAMNKMLDDMFEGSIPTVDRTDDIQRDDRRREQADLDSQYAALFDRRTLDEIQENAMKAQREKTQAGLDAQYAALFAAQDDRDDINVPGADIRPNTRTIPVPPPMPPRRPTPLLEDIVGPIESDYGQPRNTPTSGFRRQGISKKGHAQAAKLLRPFEGQQSRITDFSPGDLSQQVLREQRGRLKPPAPRIATEEDIDRLADTTFNTALQRALQAKFANTRQEEDADGVDAFLDDVIADSASGRGLVGGGRPNRRFVGGVLRRLHGMGFFDRDGLDNILYPMPKAMDNKQLLADAKAAYAAKGGAMGGSVVLAGVPTPMTGGYPIGVGADSDEYKLHYVAFPDDKWTTSSSLRWIRSNGIVPIKKAMHIPEYYKYQIMPPSDNKDYIGHELVSRGRKILLGYARPTR